MGSFHEGFRAILRVPEVNFGCPNGRFPKSRQDATSRCLNMAALIVSAWILRGLQLPRTALYHSNFTNWEAGG
jgi:hypothetical protein